MVEQLNIANDDQSHTHKRQVWLDDRNDLNTERDPRDTSTG